MGLLDWLHRGEIDVAILYDPHAARSLRSEPLLLENLFLIGPPGSGLSNGRPVPFADLDGKRIDEAVDLRHFWEDLGDTEKIPKVKEGDMIIVYKKTITWTVFMTFVRDAVSLFTVYLLITSYTSK